MSNETFSANRDYHDTVEFLEQLRPGGPWVLTAIIPDGHTETITCTTHEDIIVFCTENDGKKNLYFSVNPVRGTPNSKAKKTDIAAIEYLFADLDPKHDESPKAAKDRYLKAIEDSNPQPTTIIDSGNGIQTLWKLVKPMELPDPSTPEWKPIVDDGEAKIKALLLKLGGTAGTQNIDRILRLPGTINIPNKTKLEKKRVRCPTKMVRRANLTILRAHKSAHSDLKRQARIVHWSVGPKSITTSKV
jgi:hypothetical protein